MISDFTIATSPHNEPYETESASTQQSSNHGVLNDVLTTGAAAGIGVGITIFVIAVLCVILFLHRRRRIRKQRAAAPIRVEALQMWEQVRDVEVALAK